MLVLELLYPYISVIALLALLRQDGRPVNDPSVMPFPAIITTLVYCSTAILHPPVLQSI